MNIAQQLRQSGKEQGRQQGIKQGRKQGVQTGMQRGIQKGMRQGMEQGRQQGIEQGRQQGMQQGQHLHAIQTVKRMLHNNFPPAMIADVSGLSLAEVRSIEATAQQDAHWRLVTVCVEGDQATSVASRWRFDLLSANWAFVRTPVFNILLNAVCWFGWMIGPTDSGDEPKNDLSL